ncbi:MAG: hypothetical protein ACLFVN_09555 [Phycisphaeraceae bacterium]
MIGLNTMHHRLMTATATLVLLAFAAPAAWAQGGQSEREMLADELVVMARQVLEATGNEEPGPGALEQAAMLLDEAAELADDDPELWQLQAEIAQRRDDAEAQTAALRQYLRLRPNDDAAQLELILSRLGQVETLDAKLERMKALLRSRSARQLSPPLRSRLATRAAMLADELADPERHAHWLGEAVKLDPTNAAAAQMLHELAMERGASPMGMGASALRLVRAAPGDASVRLILARQLLEQNAFGPAVDQFQTATMLSPQPLPLAAYTDWAAALADQGDRAQALELLGRLLPAPSKVAPEEDGQAPMDPELDLLRLALAGPDAAVSREQAYERVRQSLERQMSEEDGVRLRRNLAWIAAVFGQELEQVESWLEEMPEDDALAQRARGWLLLQRRETEAARELLEPLAEGDPVALLGLSRLAGSDAAEARLLREVLQRAPSQVAGVLAAARLHEMGESIEPTQVGRGILRAMDRLPSSILDPAPQVSPWTVLDVSVPRGQFRYLDPVRVKLRLRNASSFPIGLGEGSVPTQVLLFAKPAVQGRLAAQFPPMVVELDRRLRLEPRESLEVEARLDRSAFGAWAAALPTQTYSFDVTAMHGPYVAPNGGLFTLPTGNRRQVRSLQVGGTPVSQETLDEQIEQARQGTGSARLRALAWLAQVGPNLPDPLATEDRYEAIREAVTGQFAELTPVEQAWTLRFLPGETEAGMFPDPLELVRASDEPLVWLSYLAAQVDDPEGAGLAAALERGDERVRQFAEARRQTLEQQAQQGQQGPESGAAELPQPGEAGGETGEPGAVPSLPTTPEVPAPAEQE